MSTTGQRPVRRDGGDVAAVGPPVVSALRSRHL